MDPAGLHIYARDKADNEVQGTFTSHKEGSVETLEGGAVDPEENGNAAADTDAQAAAEMCIRDRTSGAPLVNRTQIPSHQCSVLIRFLPESKGSSPRRGISRDVYKRQT